MEYQHFTMNKIRKNYNWQQKTHIMAIINATPDSFTGDGLLNHQDSIETAIHCARKAFADGADIIDIGAVSSFPGADRVEEAEELKRLIPHISAIAKEVDLPISVDSYNARVANAALEAGAAMVNSIWGVKSPDGKWNENLISVVREKQVPIVITHNKQAKPARGTFGAYVECAEYKNVVTDIITELEHEIDYAIAAGIDRNNIIVDPGIGLGKTPEQNLVLLRNMKAFRRLNFPLLLSCSKKSVIGYALSLAINDREDATITVSTLAANIGYAILRVHNVPRNRQAVDMVDVLNKKVEPKEKQLISKLEKELRN